VIGRLGCALRTSPASVDSVVQSVQPVLNSVNSNPILLSLALDPSPP